MRSIDAMARSSRSAGRCANCLDDHIQADVPLRMVGSFHGSGSVRNQHAQIIERCKVADTVFEALDESSLAVRPALRITSVAWLTTQSRPVSTVGIVTRQLSDESEYFPQVLQTCNLRDRRPPAMHYRGAPLGK